MSVAKGGYGEESPLGCSVEFLTGDNDDGDNYDDDGDV
jgi:hypothetical protein